MPRIVQLLASPVHRYVGRPADGPAPAPPGELVDQVRLRGIVGDRYFGKAAHREASVTVIAQESLPPGVDLAQVRRNVLTTGIAVDELVGSVLTLDSGDGPVSLRVHRPARPCAWLDVSVGPGTWKALRGRGGIRCSPVNDGILRVGPVEVRVGG
ncbi:molybdenum cofactor biosysynthesis protein [Micromonospora psammae]|uniref:molybdenum cofactor biosysynthesis protein n=1 Tax=Micromonospora sp. CPCC 205556 TaxID=3122398 RepID=UPI002FF34F50